MIVERSMSQSYLSNAYLVADGPGGRALFVDAGAPTEPLLRRVESDRLTVTHVLLTHHHGDHTAHAVELAERFDCPIVGHPAERELFPRLDVELADGDELSCGGLAVRAMHTPGHTIGQLAFLVNERTVFTGDTLFRRSVGGTLAPGHATFADLRRSIMDVLMRLPHETAVHPGHTDPTTIGEEWEHNRFVRAWCGVDPVTERRCTVFGRPATLLLEAEDYDGGTKCWVRLDEGERLEIAPGSRVSPA